MVRYSYREAVKCHGPVFLQGNGGLCVPLPLPSLQRLTPLRLVHVITLVVVRLEVTGDLRWHVPPLLPKPEYAGLGSGAT
jgi:hypothetical protein